MLVESSGLIPNHKEFTYMSKSYFPVDCSFSLSWVHGLIQQRASEMEPKDFCLKWVKHLAPGEWGYYKACVEELSKATGLAPTTVSGWGPDFGKRPKSVLVTLAKEDALRDIEQILEKLRKINLDNYN